MLNLQDFAEDFW